jgi:hypothetical protein
MEGGSPPALLLRAPPFRPKWRCATANLSSLGGPRAVTSTTNRSRGSLAAQARPGVFGHQRPRPFGQQRGTAPTRSLRGNRARLGVVAGPQISLNDGWAAYRRREDGPNARSRPTRPLGSVRDGAPHRRNEFRRCIGQRRALQSNSRIGCLGLL